MTILFIKCINFNMSEIYDRCNLADAIDNEPPLTLREQLWLNPTLVYLRSGRRKGSDLVDAVGEDIHDGLYGGALPIGSLVAAGVTQGYDRVRIVVQKAPPHAIEAMQKMEFSKPSVLAAAGIVAGSFAVWNFFAGEVLNRTIAQFPKTTEKFIETFPRITRAAENAVPQELHEFNMQRAEQLKAGDLKDNGALDKSARARFRRGLKRGWSGFSLGSTIHMGVSAASGIPVEQRTKINAEISRDTAVLSLVPLTAGIAEVIRQAVVSGDQQRAASILSWAGNQTTWNWVAGGVVALTFGGNLLARKKVDSGANAAKNPNGPTHDDYDDIWVGE